MLRRFRNLGYIPALTEGGDVLHGPPVIFYFLADIPRPEGNPEVHEGVDHKDAPEARLALEEELLGGSQASCPQGDHRTLLHVNRKASG